MVHELVWPKTCSLTPNLDEIKGFGDFLAENTHVTRFLQHVKTFIVIYSLHLL
jgi:hypothetical protein